MVQHADAGDGVEAKRGIGQSEQIGLGKLDKGNPVVIPSGRRRDSAFRGHIQDRCHGPGRIEGIIRVSYCEIFGDQMHTLGRRF